VLKLFLQVKKPYSMQIALIILDGWGHREDSTNNAIKAAKTPNFDRLWSDFPHTLLEASGLAVGLPEGQMGNSEIGHTTIGAGRAIDTDLVRIKKSINSGEFARNKAFIEAFEHVHKNNSTLHLLSLLGDGGVHAHQEHLFAILRAAKEHDIKKVAVHVFTDGRDTPPQSAGEYLKELEVILSEVGNAHIASISGRYFAMDRDNNFDRLAKFENVFWNGEGKTIDQNTNISSWIKDLYLKENILDEHLEPHVCLDKNNQKNPVMARDSIIFLNFRSDRARMLSEKILAQADSMNLCFVTMTEYSKKYICKVAFTPVSINCTLASEISRAGLTQAHIAETEKFPHATYFLNGGRENPHDGEKHILLDSRKDVKTHDEAPEMRAEAIADKAIEEIQNGTNFIFINFANPDMVGHTANVSAIVKAVEKVDKELGRVYEAMNNNGGYLFVTADHGNAEVNIDPLTGEKHTAHTINLVPAILTKSDISLRNGGTLADITPTILKMFGIDKPSEMTGENILN
jgi:2,3-bisphosphoglycerate-independent phosphoglycerate mutase